jgi:hypothetical protein
MTQSSVTKAKAKAIRRWEQKNPGVLWPGYKLSKEIRENMSENRKGKPRSDEAVKKTSETKRNGVKDEDCPIIVPGSRMEQVIIGSLLGDGSISCNASYFTESHCSEQKEIIFELARLLEPLWKSKEEMSGKALFRVRTCESSYHRKKYGREKLRYYVHLPSFPVIRLLRELWYPEGKKIVPDGILDKIGPQALAWWYLGDGSYHGRKRSVKLCTCGFTPGDRRKLVEVLMKMGFVSASVGKSNAIKLSRADTQKFLPLVAEYIMPTMRYKLGSLESTYKPYNSHHYDPEPIVTERMLVETSDGPR